MIAGKVSRLIKWILLHVLTKKNCYCNSSLCILVFPQKGLGKGQSVYFGVVELVGGQYAILPVARVKCKRPFHYRELRVVARSSYLRTIWTKSTRDATTLGQVFLLDHSQLLMLTGVRNPHVLSFSTKQGKLWQK